MESFWPADLAFDEKNAPVTILREQASLLGQQTQNIVQAQVEPMSWLTNPEKFGYAFYIITSLLENYRYKLFTIEYDVNLYPVTVKADEDIRDEILGKNIESLTAQMSADSEEAFSELLKKIFHSQKTKKIIRAILSQSVTA